MLILYWFGYNEEFEHPLEVESSFLQFEIISKSHSLHVVGFLKTANGLIAEMDEYWGDDGAAPE